MNEIKGLQFSDISNLSPKSEEEIAAYENKNEEVKKEQTFKFSGVGKRYLNKTFNDFDVSTEEQQKQLTVAKKFIADVNNAKQRTLWFCGKPGTGKTLLAALICRETMGKYCKSYEIANDLEAARSFSSKENKSMVIKKYSDFGMLVIDEVGKFKSAEEVGYLFQILNERYENETSTILVTNLSKSDLKSYLGEPLYDRFTESCTSVEFNGESYRIKERE